MMSDANGPPPKVNPMAKFRECRSSFDFAQDLQQAAKVLGIDSARQTAVVVAHQLAAEITVGTPVDTGRARANWFVAEGAPRLETTESTVPQHHAAVPLTGKTVIYVTNSLPYIVPLEYGHSKQAPYGMVRRAIAKVRAMLATGRTET